LFKKRFSLFGIIEQEESCLVYFKVVNDVSDNAERQFFKVIIGFTQQFPKLGKPVRNPSALLLFNTSELFVFFVFDQIILKFLE
jgi:hypothetical protein